MRGYLRKFLCGCILATSLTVGGMIIDIEPPPLVKADLEVYKIPQGYCKGTCQKPAHLTFYDWLSTLQMPLYEKDGFDCSQRSAYVEWLSENCNHKANIAGKFGPGWGHLWVMIDLGGIPFAYETTRATGETPWVTNRSDWYYTPNTEWESLYEAPWAHSRFNLEYAWWLTYPSLVTAKEYRR